MIIVSAIFALLLVASTGWIVSPFFFTLYLLAILLGFTFTPSTSVAFILTLAGLFSFDIGTIDIAYDYLTILSLLTVIPLTFYLRKEYLRLKETEKEILVIRKDEKVYQNKVEDLLANKVNDFAVNLRQPINDTKQLAFPLKKNATHESG
jgi:predicted membrane protein